MLPFWLPNNLIAPPADPGGVDDGDDDDDDGAGAKLGSAAGLGP